MYASDLFSALVSSDGRINMLPGSDVYCNSTGNGKYTSMQWKQHKVHNLAWKSK
jgi:hypothetical protein